MYINCGSTIQNIDAKKIHEYISTQTYIVIVEFPTDDPVHVCARIEIYMTA